MAETTVADLKINEHETVMSNQRSSVALEASMEIVLLCGALRRAIIPNDDMQYLVVRGMASRMEKLGNAIGTALSDSLVKTIDLREVVVKDAA